ncbi:MAG: flavodoxin family protein [Desulfobulbaceae bacterium]|nr:flavodoxin family protein [Desulfobulbaceae bacterium]
MKILGVSGSPIKNSNTDRAVQKALEATGLEFEFVKLTDYAVAPCLACLGCLETNKCVIKDDGVLLAEKAKNADALIIGGFTPYSSLDARTKAFLERLYPLRHKHGFMQGKPGGAIITCAVPENNDMLPPAYDFGVNAIKFFMMEEGMDFVGGLRVEGNVPCIKCGHGDECKMSGVKMLHGPEATVGSVGVHSFEEQNKALDEAVMLGEAIAKRLHEKVK